MSSEQNSTQKLVALALGSYLLGSASVCLYKHFKNCSQKKQCPFTGKAGKRTTTERVGCIELGGTSIRLAIGIKKTQSNGKIDCEIVDGSLKSIETQNPDLNVQQIKEYFADQDIDRVGIASFGPVCLDKTSDQYGSITSTPKKGWQFFPLLNKVSEAIPHRRVQAIGFDTDVNAAAFAEFNSGKHNAKQSLAYITVGTGVGVGLIADGKCVHGLTHPEGGHILVRPYPGDTFKGVCNFHGNCIEGLVTNHAIAERLKTTINQLASVDDSEEVWEHIAYYLAQLCLNLTLIASPEVIVIGGGIMNRKNLVELIRQQFIKLLNEYVQHSRLSSDIEHYIVKPYFADSGLIGSMVV